MMTTQAATQPDNYEHKIITILRRLPPEQGQQILAFARFLAYETFQTTDLDFLTEDANLEATAADQRWDALLESEEGQLVLDSLTNKARAEIQAGKAKTMVFTQDGEIAPR